MVQKKKGLIIIPSRPKNSNGSVDPCRLGSSSTFRAARTTACPRSNPPWGSSDRQSGRGSTNPGRIRTLQHSCPPPSRQWRRSGRFVAGPSLHKWGRPHRLPLLHGTLICHLKSSQNQLCYTVAKPNRFLSSKTVGCPYQGSNTTWQLVLSWSSFGPKISFDIFLVEFSINILLLTS